MSPNSSNPPPATFDDPGSTSTSLLDRVGAGERRAVEIVRAGVEERTWQAFWQVVVDGRPVSEVAAELGISPQVVYDAKYRLRSRIQHELEGLTD